MGGTSSEGRAPWGEAGSARASRQMGLLYRDAGWLLGTVRVVGASTRWALDLLTTALWKLLLAEMGRGSRVSLGAAIVRPKRVHLGRRCVIARGARLTGEKGGGDLVLGNDVTVLGHAVLDHTGGLTVEDGAWISREAFIMTHDHGRDPRSRPRPSPLRIGRNAWVGLRAIILPQVREIGEGAVIGAGAVLTRDAPPYSVMAGDPARVVDWGAGVGSRAPAAVGPVSPGLGRASGS